MRAAGEQLDVVFIGAVNVDLLVRLDRRPLPGETVAGLALELGSGGKAANQAVAAAQAGARTKLIGAVGADAAGKQQCRALAAAGVDVTGVLKVADKPTGTAIIMLTPDGENSIVIVSGANAAITSAWIAEAVQRLAPPTIVSAQTEAGAPAVDAAADFARAERARFQLNVSPVVDLAAATYAASNPLVVNEHEARELCGQPAPNEPTALAALLRRRTRAQSVIVTLGSAGAAICSSETREHVPAVEVSAVDTTGAGDVFAGVLATALSRNRGLPEAVRDATQAAAEAVTWVGARRPSVAAPASSLSEGALAHLMRPSR